MKIPRGTGINSREYFHAEQSYAPVPTVVRHLATLRPGDRRWLSVPGPWIAREAKLFMDPRPETSRTIAVVKEIVVPHDRGTTEFSSPWWRFIRISFNRVSLTTVR